MIEAPGYKPAKWFHPIKTDEAKNGRIEIRIPEFVPVLGIDLFKSQFDPPSSLTIE